MSAWIATNLAPIMFAALVVFLLLGYPVAFSLGACGLFFFVIGVELAPLSKGQYQSRLGAARHIARTNIRGDRC